MWPVEFQTADLPRSTVYLPQAAVAARLDAHGYAGQWWRTGRHVRSYMPSTTRVYKSLDPLGLARPEDEEPFWRLMAEVQAAGLKPPASYTSLWTQVVRQQRPIWSMVAPFVGRLVGAWERAFVLGEVPEPVYQYDLNSAYRWAAEHGLWDLRSAEWTTRWTDRPALYVVEGVPPEWRPYPGGRGPQVVSSEERDALDLREPPRILAGVRFPGASHDIRPFFERVETLLPSVAKAVCRTFWGAWFAVEPVTQVSGASEADRKERPLKPLFTNPVLAHLLLSRVKLRQVGAMDAIRRTGGRVLRVYVDALYTTQAPPAPMVGRERGQYRKVATYPHGVIMLGSGQALHRNADGSARDWIVRSGITTGAAETFLRDLVNPRDASDVLSRRSARLHKVRAPRQRTWRTWRTRDLDP